MRNRLITTLALVPVLALSACAGTRELPPSDISVPAAWAAGAAPGAAALDVPDRSWWGTFGSTELETLIAEAMRSNADLAAAAERVVQAKAQVQSVGAGLLPGVDLSGSAGRNWRGETIAGNSFRTGFDASYEIDLWDRNALRARSAEMGEQAAEFDRLAAALSLSAEVAVAYFQYLSLLDRLQTSRDVLETAERVLEVVEARSRAGAASGLELAQQRGAVASLRAGIPSLERQLDQSENALAVLLGRTPGGLSLQARSLDGLTLPTVAPGLPADILARRPDLRSAERALEAAHADAGAARAAMFPSIRLTGGSGFGSDALASLFDPVGFFANLASGLAAPLFDGGRLEAGRDAAESRGREVSERYRAAVLNAFRDVEDSLTAVEHLAAVETAQAEALEEARRANELAEARYRTGASDFLTVLDTQRTLLQREESLAQTRLGRLNAAVALYKALGGGWEA